MSRGIPHIMDGKLVTFLAEDKLVLHGFLSEKRKTKRCIVYLHGMSSNFYHSILAKMLAIKAADEGYSMFLINTRGHDAISRGNILSGKKGKRIEIGTLVERFEDSVYDIGGALKFLKSRGYNEFVLLGHSTGCQKILYYQYKRNQKSVKALVHLAPDDDYHLNKKELGRKWNGLVNKAKRLEKAKKGYVYNSEFPFAPSRFLSIADKRNVEERLFDYDGKLAEFAKVKTPTYVVFGTADEGAVKPVIEYIRILWERSKSRKYGSLIINGAKHSLRGYEGVVAYHILRWLKEIEK